MAVHKLIIAEKPSVAEAIAHTVGARDKVYAKESKNFCYEGNGYYVANAAEMKPRKGGKMYVSMVGGV